MQTNLRIIVFLIISCTILFVSANKADPIIIDYSLITTNVKMGINNDSTQIVQLEGRLLSIQSMDFSRLSTVEKKDLRHELNQMLKKAKSYNNAIAGVHPGIYIPLGTIIIIIAVLLLVLR